MVKLTRGCYLLNSCCVRIIEDCEDWWGQECSLWLDESEAKEDYIFQPRNRWRSSTMTIGIALVGTDGIILASDSRKMFLDGSYNDNAQKIFELTPTVGVVTVGGHAGYQDWLVHKFESKLYRVDEKLRAEGGKAEAQTLPFEDTVDLFVRDIREDYDFITSKASRLGLSRTVNRLVFILAGYDSKSKPCVVNLDSGDANYPFAPNYMTPPQCIGGVSEIWQYWTKQFDEQGVRIEDMNIRVLKLLVTFMISETAKAHNLVGGKPQIAIIRKGKSIENIGSRQIEKLQYQAANMVDIGRITELLRR